MTSTWRVRDPWCRLRRWLASSRWWVRGPSHHAASQTLLAGHPLRLDLHRGETLLVREGRLWLTREGDPHDHLIAPGSGYVASAPQEVVVEALGAPLCRYERHRLTAPRPGADVAGVSAPGRG